MGKMRLEDVIAPLAPKEFIDRYLSREMLVVAATRRRFAHLLSWEELNGALNRIRVSGRRMRLYQDGKRLDPDLFLEEPEHEYGSQIKGAEFERLLAAGATLVLDKVDDLFLPIRELTEAFEEVFHVHTWVNLYAGWRTQNGFDLHFDGHDTMILQVHGRKHWKVYRPTRLHPFKDDVEAVERPAGAPVWEGVLEDGGVLYMPRGWWHVACPLDEPSLHLTIGLAHPTGAQMLEWFVTQLKALGEARMDVPHLKSPAEQSAWIAAMRENIVKLWSDDVVDRFMVFQDTLAVARPDVRLPINAARHIVLTPETRLRLASGRRLYFADAPGSEVSFIVQDKLWTCAAHLVPALARLSHLHGESIAELCAAVPSSAAHELKLLLSALAMRGVVSVEPGGAS
jgi:ribosomal protein L16 Arg81 hydroxylase